MGCPLGECDALITECKANAREMRDYYQRDPKRFTPNALSQFFQCPVTLVLDLIGKPSLPVFPAAPAFETCTPQISDRMADQAAMAITPSRPLHPEEVFRTRGKVRTLVALTKDLSLNLGQIVEATCQNHNNAVDNLAELVKEGLVRETKYGRIKVYALDESNPKVSAMRRFFAFWEK